MHFLEHTMFVLNAYFCRELRFVTILHSKLRFLLRNTGVDSDFTQNFWGKNWRLGALVGAVIESFSDLGQFVSKLPNENGRGAWQCTICQVKGSSRDNMKRHVEAHHYPGFLQHKCNLCDNESETKERLLHHIRTKHGDGSSSHRTSVK